MDRLGGDHAVPAPVPTRRLGRSQVRVGGVSQTRNGPLFRSRTCHNDTFLFTEYLWVGSDGPLNAQDHHRVSEQNDHSLLSQIAPSTAGR